MFEFYKKVRANVTMQNPTLLLYIQANHVHSEEFCIAIYNN